MKLRLLRMVVLSCMFSSLLMGNIYAAPFTRGDGYTRVYLTGTITTTLTDAPANSWLVKSAGSHLPATITKTPGANNTVTYHIVMPYSINPKSSGPSTPTQFWANKFVLLQQRPGSAYVVGVLRVGVQTNSSYPSTNNSSVETMTVGPLYRTRFKNTNLNITRTNTFNCYVEKYNEGDALNESYAYNCVSANATYSFSAAGLGLK